MRRRWTSRRAPWAGLLLLATVACVGDLRAQEPRARIQVDTSLVAVGDRIGLTVTVEHEPGARVLWPDSLDLSPFEVVSAERLPTTADEALEHSAARFELTVFELGELEIPSFDIEVLGVDEEVRIATTDAWGVEVVTVGLDEDGSVRGIKGPLAIARGWTSLLPGLLLALALIVFGIWMLRRKPKGEGRTLGPVKMRRPPHEVAYDELDRLERSRLLAREEVKEFHVRVSEIVRTYVEGRYDLPALEMTTHEVVDGLSRVGIEGDLLEDFRRFLERADLVKFAKFRPTDAASREMISRARDLVDRTAPRMMEFDEAEESDGGEEEVAVGVGAVDSAEGGGTPTEDPVASAGGDADGPEPEVAR